MTMPRGTPSGPSMTAFRRRLNAFFGHPRAPEFVATLDPPAPRPATTASGALAARLEHTMTRLGASPAGQGFRLRKSLTMHDGEIVAMTGDFSVLRPSPNVRVVTTTTTVMDPDRMRTETTVLVFERQPTP
jgi:hypothetical protein